MFSTEIYNVSAVHLMDGWVFIEPANGLQAWAAVKYAWGGLNASASSIHEGVSGGGNHSFHLVPTDPWAPAVVFAGNGSTFGSLGGFIKAVVGAELSVTKADADGARAVSFTPPAGESSIAALRTVGPTHCHLDST